MEFGTSIQEWRRVWLPDEGSSRNHSLDSGELYLFQAFVVGFCVKPSVMWEDEWRHYISIASDHTSTLMSTGCLCFINWNMNLASEWNPNTLKSLSKAFCCKFLRMWTTSCYCFSHRKCLTVSSLLQSRHNLKQIPCAKLIISNNYNFTFAACILLPLLICYLTFAACK